jgi:hypothetical protein
MIAANYLPADCNTSGRSQASHRWRQRGEAMSGQVQFRGPLPAAAVVDPLAAGAGSAVLPATPGWCTPWCRYPPITAGPPASAADGQDSGPNFLGQWIHYGFTVPCPRVREMEGNQRKEVYVTPRGSYRKGSA